MHPWKFSLIERISNKPLINFFKFTIYISCNRHFKVNEMLCNSTQNRNLSSTQSILSVFSTLK